MANLYLINKVYGENGLKLARLDANAQIVLIQDGVYIDVRRFVGLKVKVYVVRNDVEKRGLVDRVHEDMELIDYDRLVDLIVQNKVINFA
ncbi:MAG TPA: DsrH/TusB family sulfur relay protein [Candidatus Avalokitesvara rifleensis]|uniref:DsrH/TusB family sulfur relay protein n=1 Tax=Candidatus Avalokitesvara rifleensis TaxID=3367620 RepID=UPI0027141F83|nr:DsrH/TusB family sulfur metabolism protein [Candidatus Brocadiales bacterium]